jgi:hypothetical protein
LLGVGIVAGVELSLSEGVPGCGCLGVQGDSLAELRDGWVVLLFSHVCGPQAETGARIARILGDDSLVEGDGLIEFPES